MGRRISKIEAVSLVRVIAEAATQGRVDPAWVERVERLSLLCEQGGSKTHIAFLGTAMIAKAMYTDIDLLAIKPTRDSKNPNAYSARSLCHGVLVPVAAELGFSLGVTGREPLNNQPYFRIGRLGDDTPVHPSARPAFDYMLRLVTELQNLTSSKAAHEALAAFIAVRTRYRPRYVQQVGESDITPEDLVHAVSALVQDESENGKRAQAVVAGLMDAFAGPERVESGRINDPSRNHPGDICLRSMRTSEDWEKAFEVRDKPVSVSDMQVFAAKCIETGVREAAVVAIAESQPPLDVASLARWAAEFGIGLTVFESWGGLVEQVLFWSSDPKPVTANRAVSFIRERLIAVEAKPAAVTLWLELTR